MYINYIYFCRCEAVVQNVNGKASAMRKHAVHSAVLPKIKKLVREMSLHLVLFIYSFTQNHLH